MDQLQAYLQTNLPPSLLSHLTTHSATYYKAYQQLNSVRREISSKIIEPLLSATTSNPDATSLILLLAVLLVSLALLRMLIRTILWWIRLAVKTALWGLALWTAAWLWHRGVNGAWGDLQSVSEIWKKEYAKYDSVGRIRAGNTAPIGQGYGRGWI
ncbi:MAG: hypothetical protein M1828_006386 [Chrysothrix sp. TS-e1954]|nr:MAG: hypothetical protein M1828_006386 [Chrysothrix sp. TS-e1954]